MDKRSHEERHAAGLKTRREVLGAEYVDKSMAATDDFNKPFTELLNTYCWNDVWNRPGLSRKERSMLNLAMLSALGRTHELKLHGTARSTTGSARSRSARCSCRWRSTAACRPPWRASAPRRRSSRASGSGGAAGRAQEQARVTGELRRRLANLYRAVAGSTGPLTADQQAQLEHLEGYVRKLQAP